MSSRLSVLFLTLLLATPTVIFWLWLVIPPARVAVLCPEGCWCDPTGYFVICSNTSLTAVPSINFTGSRDLWLIDNKIRLLEKEIFLLRGLTELEVLSVDRCGVRKVELGAFTGLTELKGLYLWGNELSEIIPGTFGNMSKLEVLHLENNKLQHLDSAVFNALVNLKYVYLGANNLQNVHPDTFLGLPKLQLLYLYNNSDLQIPTDSNFIKSHSLSYLNISGCNVRSVSVETFTNVSALEQLDLSYNNLKTVDKNILRALPKLSGLYLYGNWLQCDCQLQEVWRWCEDLNITTEYGGKLPECDTPSEVKGMGWGVVLDKGNCVQGNENHHGDYGNKSYNYYNQKHYSYTGTTDTNSYNYDVKMFKEYQVPVFAVLFIFGTTSNVIILMIITCNKNMRTVPNMYIINLATNDIIFLTVLLAEACANRSTPVTWLHGDFLCTFILFCRRLSVGLSAYSVAVLSIQRYRVTVYNLHARFSSPTTWRDIVATICGVWIVAALFSIPSAVSKYSCEGFLLSHRTPYYQHVVIFELLVSSVIPLCLIVFTYTMTALHLMESSRSISEVAENPQLNTRRNTAKIVVGLTVVFMISYVPYHAFWSYIIWTSKDNSPFTLKMNKILYSLSYDQQYQYLISTCFLFINPCLNPVALFCTSSHFRQHLKRYLTCCYKTNSPPADLELRRIN